MVLTQNSHTVQWDRMEEPDVKLGSYILLIYDKEAKNMHWINDKLFSK